MEDRKKIWYELQKADDETYLAELKSVDPDRIGLKITCPDCNASSWIKLPEKRYAHNPISIACPVACGAYYPLGLFNPHPKSKFDTDHFDLETKCKRDGTEFALNGALFRCPICGIENPREVMENLVKRVKLSCTSTSSKEILSNFLGEIVSTFDGVMRRCNKIAIENCNILGGNTHPSISSFQNVSAARDKLLPKFDIARAVSDWPRYIMTFQKRHLFAHSLGVVDAEYIRKSGDASSIIGKQVSLTHEEIISLAENSESIVRRYFAHFLS